jgi:polysaccharide transporter, PST family
LLKKIKNTKPLENLFYLGLSQGSNLLIPILIIPYLIKTVGIERFGIIALIQTICSFFFIITDYGFNITAVKSISVNRHDKEKVIKIINEVLGTKLFLTPLSLPVFFGVCWFILKENASVALILMNFMLVAGQAFFPIWLFQGIEKNQYITYTNIVSKVTFIILLFALVNTKEDYILCNFLLGSVNFISGIIVTYIYLKRELNQKFQYVPFASIKKQLNVGKEIFISNFSINTYINSNILILTFFVSPHLIGIYSIVEKIIFLIRSLLGVFIQAIYSSACHVAYHQGFIAFTRFIYRYFLLLIVPLAFFTVTVYYYSDYVVSFFSKKDIQELSYYVRLLIIVPFIVALNIPAYITLLVYNFKKYNARILMIGAFLSIFLSLILVPKLLIEGTVWSIIITEIFITVTLSITVYLLKLNRKINENHI